MQLEASCTTFDRYGKSFLCILTACLLSLDITSGLSVHSLVTPLLTALVISWPTKFLPTGIRIATQIIVGEAIIIICLVDCFCQVNFGSSISPQILTTISQSNLRETGEFLSMFVTWHSMCNARLLVLCLLIPLCPLSYLWHPRKTRQPRRKWMKYAIAGILMAVVAIEAPAVYRFSQFFITGDSLEKCEGYIFRHYHVTAATPLHRLAYSKHVLNLSNRTLMDIKRATLNATIDSCSYSAPHIVLVIGESYNKRHSSLYGYALPTTPRQAQRAQRGELMVFRDVVSPWNITSNVMLQLFSTWNHGMEGDIGDYPLFPVLFRKAGYTVSFFTNQFQLRGFHKSATNQSGNFFLSNPELSDTLFNHRNHRKRKYDMALIHDVKVYRKRTDSTLATLDIVHLIGQHFKYAKRYPHELTQFSTQDYAARGLDTKASKTVMHYDNATHYNDLVLDSLLSLYENDDAIVIFLSDHGEEVYDEDPVSGRQFQRPTASIARHEYEVPMWIWCSSSFRNNHPDVIQLIEEAQRKAILSTSVSQLLLQLAGIASRWNNTDRSPLSPAYHCPQRIIGGCVDYDQIVTEN